MTGLDVTRKVIRPRKAFAFSLVELVLVVIIIGILAGIAVPRIARAGKAARENALAADLDRVRAAMDHYYAEHNSFPGYHPGTSAADGDWFVDQLTKYSDPQGYVSDSPSARFCLGPYLRAPFPTNPITGASGVKVQKKELPASVGKAFGWVSSLSEGTFEAVGPANANEVSADEALNEDLVLEKEKKNK